VVVAPDGLTRRGGRARIVRVVLVAIVLALIGPLAGPAANPLGSAGTASVRAAANDTVRILIGPADNLDPAAQGDIGSAAISAQLFESLTAIDAQLQTRPALAASWEFRDGGATVVFHLRAGLAFSDGTPITAADVVRSWFRIIDPAHPSPLVSLIGDVKGALAYSRGESADKTTVGLTVEGADVVVHLVRPATDFPTIVASPTFAIVPPGIDSDPAALTPGDGFVASGGYTVSADTPAMTTLSANDRYWGGRPPIGTIQLIHDIGGRSSVAAFEAGDLDLTDVSPFDATWLAYDDTLGPQLRRPLTTARSLHTDPRTRVRSISHPPPRGRSGTAAEDERPTRSTMRESKVSPAMPRPA
jgi:ABC-type transport system substrate-binding protein